MVAAQAHILRSPGIEEEASVDSSAGALALANGPKLLEGLIAIDGGRVGTGALAKRVCCSVVCDSAAAGGRGAGVVLAVGLDDVATRRTMVSPELR